MPTGTDLVVRRSYPVPPERIWELWTTPAGIAAWAPDGFTTTVDRLDLRPGGALDYTMTATGPEQIAFMEQAGMPLSTRSHKEFTEVLEQTRLAYTSLIDFVPGLDPYEHLTVVTLQRTAHGTDVEMRFDPLHDEDGTERILAGRVNELDNLGRIAHHGRRRSTAPRTTSSSSSRPRAAPTTIRRGSRTSWPTRASGPLRDQMTGIFPLYEDYAQKTDREIAIVLLAPQEG